MARHAYRCCRLLPALGLALALQALVPLLAGAMPVSGEALSIAPSSTRAGIARVHLEVDDLRQTGETLEGTYRIRVPLWPRENDTGRIVLHRSSAFGHLDDGITTMTGSAASLSGQVNEVEARLLPDGVVRIRIVTPKRTLTFKSRLVSR